MGVGKGGSLRGKHSDLWKFKGEECGVGLWMYVGRELRDRGK